MRDFFGKHYEKIILAGLLTLFIFLLIYQLFLWKQSQEVKMEGLKKFSLPMPNYDSIQFNSEKSEFNVLAMLPKELTWQKSAARGKHTDFTDLMIPYEMSYCPYCRKVLASSCFPTEETSVRKVCPYESCGKMLRQSVSMRFRQGVDTDGDGIPDKEELVLGLNPRDASDADADRDSDGFTNLEEYLTKTSITDPKDRRMFHEKLQVERVSHAPLPFTLKNVTFSDRNKPETAQLQVQMISLRRNKRRTSNIMINYAKTKYFDSPLAGRFDIVEVKPEFKKGKNGVEEENGTVVVIRKEGTQEKINMKINEPVYESKERVVLHSLALKFTNSEKNQMEFMTGDTFGIGNLQTGIDEYKIVSVDLKARTVTLLSLKNNKQYTIGRPTQMEKLVRDRRASIRATGKQR